MRVHFLIIFCAAMIAAENDESWTWNNDKEKTQREKGEARYQIYERPDSLESIDNVGVQLGFRPQNPGPYGPNSRPLAPTYPGNSGVLVGPGGPTGVIGRPPRIDGFGGQGGILDSVPAWIRGDPRYREFDVCKCRYSFNCPSPGLKFGHCSRSKKYCCFNSRKFPELLGGGGNNYPYYPGANPNKYGPLGFAPNYYGNRRPPYGNPYQQPSFGDYYAGSYGGGYGHRNDFESLRPYGYDADPDDYEIYGRSLSKNQTRASDQETKTNETNEKQ